MLFSCGPGSNGEGEECYSIIFPLVFSPGKKLNTDEKTSFQMDDGHSYTLEKHHHQYSLKIESFYSQEEARTYLEKLTSALRWFSLKNKLGIKFPSEIHQPKMAEKPIMVSEKSNFYKIVTDKGWKSIDGNYDIDKLNIIRENSKLMRWESGQANITLGLSPDHIFSDINEGLSYKGLKNIVSEKKLCIAIELYSAYQFEVSTTAKFIKLVTVIESLLPNFEIPESVLPILESAKKVVKSERKAAKSDGLNTEAIDRLLSRIGGLKRQSIGATMESYIAACLEEFPELGSKEDLIPKLKELYNVRSSLLHDGEYEESILQQGIEILAVLVPNLLTKLYIKHAG